VDPSIRPNQIFAVSLPFKVVSPEQAAGILAVVEENLLTDFGLRTLAPRDPAYKGVYGDSPESADQYHRDLTYHQGTAWPFLLGHWVDARVAVHGQQRSNFELISERLLPLIQHMNEEACIGSISEIFDGDEPHRPMGCVAQAWSVAEMTRVVLKYPQLREILEARVSPPAVSV
jgi:glycogen debranching enzyme